MVMGEKILVEAIKEGTVIDHIPAGRGMDILRVFKLAQLGKRITVGFNLISKDHGVKDLIKIEDISFSEKEANKLSLLVPEATVNVIENYQVSKKYQLSLPETAEDIFSCPNSNCASHTEPVKSFFYLRKNKSAIKLKCKFCEKSFAQEIFSQQF